MSRGAPPAKGKSRPVSALSLARSVEPGMTEPRMGASMVDEGTRTRLIGEISCLLREPAIPESARSAGLELIGWLARRMPGEAPHALGVREALEAERTRRKGR